MKRLAEALVAAGQPAPRTCVGSKYHSPTPLKVEDYEVGGKMIPLCGTCADNLTTYRVLMAASNGRLPWEIRREFGNLIRALGTSAWEHEGTHG